MNDDYMYKSDDEEEMNIGEDLGTNAASEDSFYDPEEEGLSDFNFQDDELPVEEAENEMDDAP
jgi:hypothetical protein